jgi:hypothetical protein
LFKIVIMEKSNYIRLQFAPLSFFFNKAVDKSGWTSLTLKTYCAHVFKSFAIHCCAYVDDACRNARVVYVRMFYIS